MFVNYKLLHSSLDNKIILLSIIGDLPKITKGILYVIS